MKKIHIALLLATVFSVSTISCNQYRSMSSASKVSQLSGNPFMYQLSKSVLKNITTFMAEKGLKSTVGKLNLLSPISAIVSNPADVSSLKNMLSTAYSIAPKKLDTQFSSLTNMKDLITFVAANGRSGFNFY